MTMEYSSSSVCTCGGTSEPGGNPCSTIATAPRVSAPMSLNSTVIAPRLPAWPSPGRTTVSGGGAGSGTTSVSTGGTPRTAASLEYGTPDEAARPVLGQGVE